MELDKQIWDMPDTLTEKKVINWVDRLTRLLTSALDKAFPLSPATTVNKNNPWFTPQLKQLRKEVGAAYQRSRNNNLEHHANEYKDRLKRYKRLVKKPKRLIMLNTWTQ